MATTYKEMKQKLRSKNTFKGNSVTARYSNGIYEVWSYNTLIYNNKGYFDNSYYSMTTSKLQNILIEVFGLNDGKKKRD